MFSKCPPHIGNVYEKLSELKQRIRLLEHSRKFFRILNGVQLPVTASCSLLSSRVTQIPASSTWWSLECLRTVSQPYPLCLFLSPYWGNLVSFYNMPSGDFVIPGSCQCCLVFLFWMPLSIVFPQYVPKAHTISRCWLNSVGCGGGWWWFSC